MSVRAKIWKWEDAWHKRAVRMTEVKSVGGIEYKVIKNKKKFKKGMNYDYGKKDY